MEGFDFQSIKRQKYMKARTFRRSHRTLEVIIDETNQSTEIIQDRIEGTNHRIIT